MRKLISHFLFFIIICLPASAFAQQKFEKEYRLKTDEVPLLARQFVDSLDFDRRVKWYMEISQDGKTMEAKSRRNGRRYSIEFDTTGMLQDVEIEVRFGDIPEKLRATITQNLDAELDRFRTTKIQEQLTGTKKNILAYLKGKQDKTNLTTRYEAIVRGSKDGERNEFEYTFTSLGKIEKRSKVVFRNTDNLLY
jgi:hypothetical protein